VTILKRQLHENQQIAVTQITKLEREVIQLKEKSQVTEQQTIKQTSPKPQNPTKLRN